MQFIAATTTFHSADVIEVFLHHMERVGAVGVLVIDLVSQDGTLDILSSRRWAKFAHVLPPTGVANDDSSNHLLAAAKQRFSGLWCLFTDPDELVGAGLRDLAPDSGVSCYALPRRNVTARRDRLDGQATASWRDLRLEIVKPVVRSRAEQSLDHLVPPWIYTRVGEKILVRTDMAAEIGTGDHIAALDAGLCVALDHVVIRHYPLRSYAAFETKVETIETYLALNPQHSGGWGWHWRRWVRIMKAGRLHDEFMAQFPTETEVARMMSEGMIREVDAPDVAHASARTKGMG